jgi:hypothetical protein
MGSESVSELVSDVVVTFVYGTTREDTDCSIIWRTHVACWMTTVTHTKTHRHALRMFDTYCLSMAKMVTRTRLNVIFIQILPAFFT